METQYVISLTLFAPEYKISFSLTSTVDGWQIYQEAPVGGIGSKLELKFFYNNVEEIENYLQILKADSRILSIVQNLKEDTRSIRVKG